MYRYSVFIYFHWHFVTKVIFSTILKLNFIKLKQKQFVFLKMPYAKATAFEPFRSQWRYVQITFENLNGKQLFLFKSNFFFRWTYPLWHLYDSLNEWIFQRKEKDKTFHLNTIYYFLKLLEMLFLRFVCFFFCLTTTLIDEHYVFFKMVILS